MDWKNMYPKHRLVSDSVMQLGDVTMAADRLVPMSFEEDDEEFLSPQETIRRLRNEFKTVEIDKQTARKMVEERIKDIRRQMDAGTILGLRMRHGWSDSVRILMKHTSSFLRMTQTQEQHISRL